MVAAAKAFNHNDITKHDSDIRAGAVAIVCSIFRSCSMLSLVISKDTQYCLKILQSLYRCSHERLCASFCTDGTTLIIYLLDLVEIHYRLGKKGDVHALVLAQSVLDKLQSGAKVPLSLIKQKDELMTSLVKNISGCTGSLTMHISMKIVASLSERSLNKQALFIYPGLMEAIALGLSYMHQNVREESARIIMNLAVESKNQVALIQSNEQLWLDAVLSLTNGSIVSKAYAVKTIASLSSQLKENKVVIVQHRNGATLGVLLQIASSRSNQPHMRVNATKTLGNLTCQATAIHLVRYPNLLVTLSSLACCQNDKLAASAALTVKKAATHIRSSDAFHTNLLQALVTMSYSKSTAVVKWTMKAYLEQAAFPCDRVSMIAHKGLLASLTMLSNDENEFVKDHAREVLSTLAADVAIAKSTGIENVLRCVVTSGQSQQGQACRKRLLAPRSYSPTSVFDVDFAAYF